MAIEYKSFHLRMDADVRLAAAAGGVARHLADAAGLEHGAIAQLQSSTVAACREAFEHLSADHPYLEVTAARFHDRIEVILSHQSETFPSAGLKAIAGFATRISGSAHGSSFFAGIDRVQYETLGEETVTRLTKYLGQPAPGI